MARPKKKKAERKDSNIRVPVTADQKELIVAAAKLQGADTAAWIRPILIQAASELVQKTTIVRRDVGE